MAGTYMWDGDLFRKILGTKRLLESCRNLDRNVERLEQMNDNNPARVIVVM